MEGVKPVGVMATGFDVKVMHLIRGLPYQMLNRAQLYESGQTAMGKPVPQRISAELDRALMNKALWHFNDLVRMKRVGLTADQIMKILDIAETAVARWMAPPPPSKEAIRSRRYRARRKSSGKGGK